MGYYPEACDQRGECGIQYVVEADGSAYPCDFYMLDEYRLGNFNENTMEEMDKRRQETGFIIASLHRISVALASTPAEKEIGAFPALGIQLAGALYKASLLTPLIHGRDG